MGIWKRLSINRPSNHRVVLFTYILFLSLLPRYLSLLPTSLLLSFSTPFCGNRDPSLLEGSTVLHPRYIPVSHSARIRIHVYYVYTDKKHTFKLFFFGSLNKNADTLDNETVVTSHKKLFIIK